MRCVYERGPTLRVFENNVREKCLESKRLELLWGIIRRVLPCCRAAEGEELRAFTCWDCEFESHQWHRYVSR